MKGGPPLYICLACVNGEHAGCTDALCCCIVIHPADNQVMTGFKLMKQHIHPERAEWTRGGFTPGAPDE